MAPSGTVFASGYSDTYPSSPALVMASEDGGATWFGPLDAFAVAASIGPDGSANDYSGRYAGIACAANGTLYVAVPQTSARWVVRQGTDGGTNWTTVDNYGFVGGGNAQPCGITVDSAGNVYVAGLVNYTNGVRSWIVRKGIGGTNYFTVDTFAPNNFGVAQAIFAHPTAGIFAVGIAGMKVTRNNYGNSRAWVVRRSLDAGTNWSTVDAFQLTSNLAEANGIGADSIGNLYVVGQATTSSGHAAYWNWVVRRSADGGNTWTTVDDFQPSATSHASATAFAADARGNLWVAGYTWASSGYVWTVRENLGGNSAWTIVDGLQYQAGYGTVPLAMTADALGNIFVGGYGYNTSTGTHWLIQKN